MSHTRRLAVLSAAAAVAGIAFVQPRAEAVVYSWIGTGSGNWSTPANWSAGLTPMSADDSFLRYIIPAGSTTFTSNNDVTAPFTLNILTVSNSSTGSQTIQGQPLRFVPFLTQQETLSFAVPNGTATFGGLTIANDIILTKDLLIAGTRFPATLSGQISGPGRLSANIAGTFNVTGNNTYTGGTRIAFGEHVWVTGGGNLGTGSVQIGDEQAPINWFGLGRFDSAANIASGNASVYVGGNSFVQFQQLDANAIARIHPSSRGMLVIDNATSVAPTLDLSQHPYLRLGAHVRDVSGGSVALNATIVPANNTYRFGAQDSAGSTPFSADTLNITSQLTDGPTTQPRSVNIAPGLTGLGGKIKFGNLNNTYSGGTVVEPGPFFFDLNTGITFDYTPAAGQTPLGTGSVQVGGSLIFEGTFGGVGALPNQIVFKPGSKLLLNNVVTVGTTNFAANLDRWGDAKPLNLTGTELTLRAVGTHTETVGATTYAEGNQLLVERTGPGGTFAATGTTTLAMSSLTRVGRGTMKLTGVGASTIGSTHRFAIASPANLVDAGTGMIHPSIIGDRPGDGTANAGDFLALAPGNVLVTSPYTTSLGAADNEIASVGFGGIGFVWGFDETLWALRTGSASVSFTSNLHVRSGGLILAGILNGGTVSP